MVNDHYKTKTYLTDIDRDILFVEMMNDCFYDQLRPRGFFRFIDKLLNRLFGWPM